LEKGYERLEVFELLWRGPGPSSHLCDNSNGDGEWVVDGRGE
jgi:hypothetical protein